MKRRLSHVTSTFGIGAGATVAGSIVASAQRLGSFQILYFVDAVTIAGSRPMVADMAPAHLLHRRPHESPRLDLSTAAQL